MLLCTLLSLHREYCVCLCVMYGMTMIIHKLNIHTTTLSVQSSTNKQNFHLKSNFVVNLHQLPMKIKIFYNIFTQNTEW